MSENSPHTFKPPDAHKVSIFKELDSTNQEALRRAPEFDGTPHWIVAHEQTRGRGREGRNWVSEIGNLYTSFLFRPQCPLLTANHLSFVTGIALHETVSTILKSSDIADPILLKWPNDVLIGRRKIAGILIESFLSGRTNDPVIVIGIGINVAHHPELTDREATHLGAYVTEVDSPYVFNILSRMLAQRIEQWDNGRRFELIRQHWSERAHPPGERLSVQVGNTRFEGVFKNLDEDGALKIKLDTGELKRVTVGDVFFSRPSDDL